MHQANQLKHGDATITLYYDENPESPRTSWDNLGKMYCKHRHYRLGDEEIADDYDSWEDVVAAMKDEHQAMVVLPLYLHDHGALSMSTGAFSDPWDSGQVGWICDTAEGRELLGFDLGKELAGAEEGAEAAIATYEDFLDRLGNMLRSEVGVYDQYLRGDIYGYIVTDDDGEEHDSCWGFYGEEDALEAAREQADWVNAHLRKLRIQAFVEEVEASATLASAP